MISVSWCAPPWVICYGTLCFLDLGHGFLSQVREVFSYSLSAFSQTSFPPPTPFHPSTLSHSTGIVTKLLSQFVSPSSSLTMSTSLFSMSRLISAIFLDSIYMLIYINTFVFLCFSFLLTSLCINRLWIHPPH